MSLLRGSECIILYTNPASFEPQLECEKVFWESSREWIRKYEELEYISLWYVWSGEGDVFLNDQCHRIEKGSCFLFKPGDDLQTIHLLNKPLIMTFVHFRMIDPPHHIPRTYRYLHCALMFETLLTHYLNLRYKRQFGYEEESQLILKQLMIFLLRNDHKIEEGDIQEGDSSLRYRIQEVANNIRQNPGSAYEIHILAEQCQLSPRYFSLKFKEIIGQPVRSFIIESKMKRAKHLLLYKNMNVTEVARKLGYNDVYFFSRQFKQYEGISPSEVR